MLGHRPALYTQRIRESFTNLQPGVIDRGPHVAGSRTRSCDLRPAAVRLSAPPTPDPRPPPPYAGVAGAGDEACDLIRLAQLRYIVYHTAGSSASRHLQQQT